MLRAPDTQKTGNSLAIRIARARPAVSSSCVSEPASKNFSISASSASATISVSVSRALAAAADNASGSGPSVILPDSSPANVYAFIATRSTTPLKSLSLPIGSWTGTQPRPSVDAHRLERAIEAGALAVETIERDQARELQLLGGRPDLFGRDLDAPDGVHDHQRRFGHAQRRQGLADEVAHPGGIDQIDFRFVPLEVGERGGERVLAGNGFVVVVGDGRAFVYLAEPVHRAGVEQQRRGQLRLACAAVSHQRHVANGGRVKDLHTGGPPISGGIIPNLWCCVLGVACRVRCRVSCRVPCRGPHAQCRPPRAVPPGAHIRAFSGWA